MDKQKVIKTIAETMASIAYGLSGQETLWSLTENATACEVLGEQLKDLGVDPYLVQVFFDRIGEGDDLKEELTIWLRSIC